MQDANGDFSGFPNQYYNVVAGQSTACMPSLPTSIPKLEPNISNADLQTCQPWGMTVSGGVPPYSVTLAVLGAPVFTNVTATTDFDRFTYINRADPGSEMIATVQDSTGQFGIGTPPVFTKGSRDILCPGLVTSWRPADKVAAEQDKLEKHIMAQQAAERTKTIVGSVVGAFIGIVAIAGFAFCWWRRRRELFRKVEPAKEKDSTAAGPTLEASSDGDVEKGSMRLLVDPAAPVHDEVPRTIVQDVFPRSFPPPVSLASSSPDSTPISGHNPLHNIKTSNDRSSQETAASPFMAGHPTLAPSTPSPVFNSTSPILPGTRAHRKALEAADQRRAEAEREASASAPGPSGVGRSVSLSTPATAPGAGVSLQRSASAMATLPSIQDDENNRAETIVIQHQDAGLPPPVVVELPPAYCPRIREEPEQGSQSEQNMDSVAPPFEKHTGNQNT